MPVSPLLAALISLCAIWISHSGQYTLHKHIRALGGVRYLRKVEVNVDSVSESTGVPKFVLAKMAHAESGLDPRKRGKLGEQGLMQLLPGTSHFREWKRICALAPEECTQANLLIGARELMRHWKACGGGWELAVARYRGNGCVAREQDTAVADKAEQLRLGALDLVLGIRAGGVR